MSSLNKRTCRKLLSLMLLGLSLAHIFWFAMIIQPALASPALTLKWSRYLGEQAKTYLAPLAANLVGDNRLEIVVVGSTKLNAESGTVTALDGTTGATIWSVTASGVGMHNSFNIVDLNKDGIPEVIINARNPLVLHGNDGSLYWRNTRVYADGLYFAVADIDGDGYPEIFMSGDRGYALGYDYITCLSYDGQILRQAWAWHPCYGGTMIGDTNFDGRFELYQGDRSSSFSPSDDPYKGGGMGVRALDAHTLEPLWNDPDILCSSHTPMLADVDKDGILDVIIGWQFGGLAVYNSADGSVLTTGGKYRKASNLGLSVHSQPTVYDIDGDGNLEIITCSDSEPKIWDLYDWKLDATLPVISGEPPKVGDVAGDGAMEIIVANGPSIDIYDKNYNLVEHVTGVRAARPFTLVQDVDGDGLNELVVTSSLGYVYCYDTPRPAPTPRVRSNLQFYSERNCGAAEYVPPLTPSQPVLTDEQPLDSSLNQMSNPTLSIRATDFQGDLMDITFRTNASGTWETIGSYTDRPNGIYSVTTTNMNELGTTYHWSVTATDGSGVTTKTYRFTTYSSPPTQGVPILTSGDYGNLIAYNQTTIDPDGDEVTNIYNWYVNDASLTNLLLPFDTRTTNNPLILDELFGDGFEYGFDKWNENGVTDWDRPTTEKHSGSYSAHAGSADNFLTSDNLDTSSAGGITVSFWYRDHGIDDDDNVYLQFWDGSTYKNIFELDVNPSLEDEWHLYTVQTYDPRHLIANFRIRFDARGIDSGEDLWIDDVSIIAPSRTKDYSGYDNHATVHGATWTSEGVVGGAYTFDGTTDFIRIPDDPTLGGDGTWSAISIEFWVKPFASLRGTRIVTKKVASESTGSYMIGFQSSGTPNTLFWGITTTTDGKYHEVVSSTSAALQVNKWYHVVATYKSGPGLMIYINGEKIAGSASLSGNIAKSSGLSIHNAPLFIGYDGSGSSTRFLKGALDEIRIYPRALKPQQIRQRYLESKDGLSNSSTLNSWETNVGEQWKCEVTPNDSYGDGTSKVSNILPGPGHQNSPPVASNLRFSSPSRTRPYAFDNENLVGTYDYSDFDDDPESGTQIRWYRNGALQSAYNDALTIPSSATTIDDEWYFTVRPKDGKDFGDLQTSPSITIIQNSPPTQGTPLLVSSAGTNRDDEDLIAYNQTTVDPDGNKVTNIYHWYRNDISLTNLLMPFDTESLTTAKDYSGYGNSGTVSGATWTEDGVVGGAYEFDGNDFIRTPDSTSLSGDGWSEISIEFWVKVSTPLMGTRLVTKKFGSYMVGFQTYGPPSNWLFWGINTAAGYDEVVSDPSSALEVGKWYHIVCTYKSGPGLTIYVNGTQICNSPLTGNIVPATPTAGDEPIFLGYDGEGGANRYLTGVLDEVRIYPRSLSAPQVFQRYIESKDGFSSNSTIVAQETATNNKWKCEIIPNDSFIDGTAKTSNEITVSSAGANSRPRIDWFSPSDTTPEVNEGRSLAFAQVSSDPNGDALTYSWLLDSVQQATTQNWTYSPDYASAGLRNVTLVVSDGSLTDSQRWDVTVINVGGNAPPTIDSFTPVDTTPEVSEGDSLEFTHTSSDPDGDPLTYSWLLDSAEQATTQNWAYTPSFNDAGTHNVTLTVSDGEFIVSQQWNVTVININRAPTIDSFYPPTDPTIHEGEQQQFNITYSDPDGDSMTVQWYLNGTPTVIADSYTFLADYESAGTYNVTVVISDGPAQASHEWNLTVLNANRAPTIDSYYPPGDPTILEGEHQDFNVTFHDPDGDPLTVQWYLNGSLVGSVDNYTFTANYESAGTYNVTVVVSDGLAEDSHEWTLTVLNVNRPPNIDSYSPEDTTPDVNEGANLDFTHTSSDPDGDPLTYSWLLDSVFRANTQNWTYLLGYDDAGNHNVTLRVSDGEFVVSQQWNVTVLNVNRAPVIDSFYPPSDPVISEGESQEFNITKSDADGDILTVQWYLNGTPTSTADSYIFDAGYTSAEVYNVTVLVSDGLAQTSHEWTLTVVEFNRPPVIDEYHPLTDPTILESQHQGFNVTYSDPDGDAITVQWYMNGSLVGSFDNYTFTADYDSAGVYNITVLISDGYAQDSHKWTLTVLNVNRAPNIDFFTPTDTTPEVSVGDSLNFTHTSSDPDGNTLFYSWFLDSVEKAASQNWSYTPGSEDTGTHNVTLVVSDGELFDSQQWNVTVVPKPVQYELIIGVSGNGNTDPAPGTYLYNEGSNVSVDALPDSGWILDHWLLDNVNVGSTDPFTVTMNNNHNLTAVFVQVIYTVHLESEENTAATSNLGSITFDGVSYSLPSDISKTAGTYSTQYFAGTGYVFDHWVATGGIFISNAFTNPTTATVSADGTLKAVYKAPIFADDFESGNFAKWSGTGVTSGETATVVNTQYHHGSYSATFTSNGNSASEGAYCYVTVPSSSELYARGYFYVSQSGIADNNDRFYFIRFRAGSNNIAYAGWRQVGGVVRWSLIIRDGTTGWMTAYSGSTPSLNQWYSVELHCVGDSVNGLGELYVDGQLVCSILGVNTAALGNVDLVRFGLAEVYNCGATTIYIDCCVVSETYIGLETLIANVHLESEENTATTFNLGSITFDGTSYSPLPADVPKITGVYSAEYLASDGYVFDHWETTDLVYVSDANANPTTVTVSGDGTLKALYRV